MRVDQPALLLVDADYATTPTLIKAGEDWVFSGSIKNLSPTETIDLVVLTHAVGNVVGSPVDRLVTPGNNPLGLRHQLEPGERLALWQRFSTMHDGAPSAKVELIVQGKVPDPGPPAGQRLVTQAETIVRTVRDKPATERHVMVNVEDPVPYSEWDGTELGWIFTDAVARGFGR